jgi:hypothetical protein
MSRKTDLRLSLLSRLGVTSRRMRRRVRATLLFALATMLVICPTAASARASGSSTNYWSADRLARLPAEIRGRVERLGQACGGTLTAGAQFERSVRDPRTGGEIVALHFHDLQCDKQIFCTGHGCLHVVYAQGPRGYRPLWSGYVDEVEFDASGSAIVLRITCDDHSRCPYVLDWTGREFTPPRSRQ